MVSTTVRGFVREFSKIRRRADAGEVIRIRGRDGVYLFKAESRAGHHLLGCCADTAPRKRSKAGPVEAASAWNADR
jgi:hypothetical protein